MKKKSLTRLLCIATTASVLLAGLAGCGSTSTDATTKDSEIQKEETEEVTGAADTEEEATETGYVMSTEPITLTVMNRCPAEYNFEDNPVLDEIAARTGVTIEWNIPPLSNYTERLQVTMAADEMCDVSYTWGFGASTYGKWAEDGMLWELDDLIVDYPNLMANIPENQWDATRVNGKIYAVPRPNGDTVYGFYANVEWLNKLNDGKIPETVDELYEYAKLVATSDPDGNGQADTFLFSPPGVWADRWIVQGFMPYGSGSTMVKLPDYDGEYKIQQKMDGYLPYLRWFRQLYTEGLIDPEFFTNNTYDDRTKFQQERVAIVSAGTGAAASLVGGLVGEENPDPAIYDDYVQFYPSMKTEEQEMPIVEVGANHWGGWMINANLDEDTVRRILGFLDWCNTEEGWLLQTAGVEGTHYNTYDSEQKLITKTAEQAEISGEVNSYATFANAYQGTTLSSVKEGDEVSLAKFEFNLQEKADALEQVELVTLPATTFPKYVEFQTNNVDLINKLETMEENFVTGNVSEEDFVAFLENEWYPAIADAEEEYIQIMNEYAASVE